MFYRVRPTVVWYTLVSIGHTYTPSAESVNPPVDKVNPTNHVLPQLVRRYICNILTKYIDRTVSFN
jgi:hypothetical protein